MNRLTRTIIRGYASKGIGVAPPVGAGVPSQVTPVANTANQDPAFPASGLVADTGSISTTFAGVSAEAFGEDTQQVLGAATANEDIEVKPDGMLYLPEIKYRRVLWRAFGAGGWGLVPRGPHSVAGRTLSREYALFCRGRFVAQARGEQDFFSDDALPTAAEGAKSNALMRCCKDLGVAWELWDPVFIRTFKAEHAVFVQATHASTGAKKWVWRRKDRSLDYPYKEDQKR